MHRTIQRGEGRCALSSCLLSVDVSEYVFDDRCHGPNVLFGEMGLHGEVTSKLNVCNRVNEFILMGLNVFPLAIVPSVAVCSKNLHWDAFLFHQIDE